MNRINKIATCLPRIQHNNALDSHFVEKESLTPLKPLKNLVVILQMQKGELFTERPIKVYFQQSAAVKKLLNQ